MQGVSCVSCCWLLLLLLLGCHTSGSTAQTPKANALAALSSLNGWYESGSGLWATCGWWNSANALTALIQCSSRTDSYEYSDIISTTFTRHDSYLNAYYDDEGWWALAWIEAYKFTNNGTYLTTAISIFKDMAQGWSTTTCGGGVWWDKTHTYKNAIPNELFLQLASSLYLITKDNTYLTWAMTEWTWFNNSGMINSHYLVNDGLTTNCKSNNETTWTYNQGVILGGLVNLYHATNNTLYLTTATLIAKAAITTLVNSKGILVEPCEASKSCGGDGPQFKGIFMRNLGYLFLAQPDSVFSTFITNNANSIWSNDRSGTHLGLSWSGPFDSADAARQSSALDALNAALLVFGTA